MSHSDDWWDDLYTDDTTPDATRDNDTTTRHDNATRHQVPDRTRQDTTPRDTTAKPGRVLTLHRPLQGPRPISELLNKPEAPTEPAEKEDTEQDTRDTSATTGERDSDTTPRNDIETPPTSHDTPETDTTDDTPTAQEVLDTLYRKLGIALERLGEGTADDDSPKHTRPKYEPPIPTRSPRAALADRIGAMPTRYRWPLYHLGAAAAGEALGYTPLFGTGLVSYSLQGARHVAEFGWLTTWSWWGTALAAAGLYSWSRRKHWLIAWPCTIPIASAVVGALLYTPNL